MGDRAVSVVVNYIAALGIVTLLIVSLFVGMSGFVDRHHEETVSAELDVVANRVAMDLGVADRLAQTATGSGGVTVRTALPDRIAGAKYRIAIEQVDPALYELTLRSLDPDVVVTERVRLQTAVAEGGVDGGDIAVRYESGTLVIEDA